MNNKITCLIVDDEPIARKILEKHLKQLEHVDCLPSCASAIEAYKVLNNTAVDLIFLDINMPVISGISFMKSLDASQKVIFTTAHREFAIDGFELNALDYLLKPITLERLVTAIQKYQNTILPMAPNYPHPLNQAQEDSFFVKTERMMTKINYSEVLFLESYGDYVKIYTENGMIMTRETMRHFDTILDPNFFLRTHRSFVIAKSKVRAFNHECICIGEFEIPISRTYKANIAENFKGFTES